MKSPINAFIDGQLSVNEYTVLVAVLAKAEGRSTTVSATEISNSLRGDLSRHAVARALRNLQRDNWLTWKTAGVNRTSTIQVN
jgi:hypothetical protein